MKAGQAQAGAGGLTRRAFLGRALQAGGALLAARWLGPAEAGTMDDVQRLTYRSDVDGLEDWALAQPPVRGTDWAVVIHGHGSAGDQLYARADIRDLWLPAFQQAGVGILTPNLRGNAWMAPPAVADLRALLERVRREYGARRFIFAGGSMGGTSNLIYAVRRPEDAAAVVALCPATDLKEYWTWCRTQTLPILKEIADAIEQAYGGKPDAQTAYQQHSTVTYAARLTMPVYVAHGAADNLIPVAHSRKLNRIVGRRATFRYVEQPNGDHDAPIRLLPDGLAWVLQRLPVKRR